MIKPLSLSAAIQASPELSVLLTAAADRREAVLLLVNDSHRATQTLPTLRAIADLADTLPARPAFRAIVATGTHKFPLAERHAFEHDTFAGCGLVIDSIDWHEGDAASTHVNIGLYCFHQSVAESTLLLSIGSVEPHYFAGLTGAHKTCTIGVVSRRDIEVNHAGALSPQSDCFILDGNPVYDGIAAMVAALQAAGKKIVAVQQILSHDRLIDIRIGDPLSTLHDLLPVARATFAREIDTPVDLIHLRVPLPLGRNLYQADKALKNNHLAVRDGGGIILEAECFEGVGPNAFLDLLRRAATYKQAVDCVAADGYRLGDHKAVKLRYLTDPPARGVHVALVTPNVSDEDARTCGMRRFGDVEQATSWLKTVIGESPRTLIIEDAGNAVVTARSRGSSANPK